MVAINLLSARKVETLKKPGKYFDGDGLFLHVRSAASRSWFFRFRWAGKKKVKGGYQTETIGLGSARDISLAEAREMRAEMRGLIAKGIKPTSPKRAVLIEKAAGITFRDDRKFRKA